MLNIAILGASGYTGAELIRLLYHHQECHIKALGADRKAGLAIDDVFPHLMMTDLPKLQKIEEIDFTQIDVVFCALPHGITQQVITSLPEHLKVIDLSADFRFSDLEEYQKWYPKPHEAPELQKKFIYGLSEIYHRDIATADYVANTGCYVASALLPLIPLVKNNAINNQSIIIDAKSGVSGAGRAPSENILFCEISEGFSAYGVDKHRHNGEIDHQLSIQSGETIQTCFTPHLLPQNRCILSTIYCDLEQGVSADNIHHTLKTFYHNAPFIHILPFGNMPKTHYVRGSNYVMIGVCLDARNHKLKMISVLDNLVKGASGQAIQNMNIMCGFRETLGLEQLPLFP